VFLWGTIYMFQSTISIKFQVKKKNKKKEVKLVLSGGRRMEAKLSSF